MGQRSVRYGALALGLAAIVLIVMATLKRQQSRHRDPIGSGLASYARGDWSTALVEARKQLVQAPEDREALRLLARASARLERDSEAELLYTRLGVRGAEAEDFFLLGSALIRRGKESPGLRMLERAQNASPHDEEVLEALGEAYHRLEYPIASVKLLRKLTSIEGMKVKNRWLLGLQLLELDQPLSAASCLNDVVIHDPTGNAVGESPARIRKQLARAWLRCGRPTEAREALQPLLEEAVDPEAAWLLSRVCLQRDDLKGAVAALAQTGDFRNQDWTRLDPAPWIGNAECAGCHPKQYRDQQGSRHAHTLLWGPKIESLPLPGAVLQDPGNAQVEHHLRHESGSVRVVSTWDDHRLSAMIHYVIGSGHRGQTPVVRDNQQIYLESRLTRYADPVGWNLTIHHPPVPETDFGFLGKPLREDQLRGCLNCHSTNPDAIREGRPEAAGVGGIGCERCHGPGGNHVRAVRLHFPDMAIAQPRLATGEQRAALCAQCHDTPKDFPAEVPEIVRFQSPSLARSRCFVESRGALDCTTCHNPHRNAATKSSWYEGICLNCHGGNEMTGPPKAVPTEDAHSTSAHSCPVDAAKGCLACHMPKIPNVVPHAAYTDHFIRVRRD